MSKTRALAARWFMDVRVGRQPLFWVLLLIYGSMLVGILTGSPERPRGVYYFSEMGLYLLSIIATGAMFQREISGDMEMVASYPVSLRAMALRKWVFSILLAAVLELGWMIIYHLKYGGIKTAMYDWKGGEPGFSVTAARPLGILLQTLPAIMLLISLTMAGIIVFKKIFAGLLIGSAVFMLDTITSGQLLERWTLYTAYLPKTASFPLNRVMLLGGSALLAGAAIWFIAQRERWTAKDEEE
ncbi:hypothetical protein [Paenibacillus caui]|uniref:hypothetical protein n=1 Tax=Paenibacillus caui TaxID=2873927 RepID=UPI001CAA2BB9|nr:hypothetical protein [Paenibacillus caui]